MNTREYTFSCKCGHKWETVCNHHQAVDQACPSCKSDTGVKIDRSEIQSGLAGGKQYYGREWSKAEQVWLEGPRINKSDLPAWRKSIPSLETNHKDQIVFKSDRHQREVFKAMSQGKRDNEARRAQEASSGT